MSGASYRMYSKTTIHPSVDPTYTRYIAVEIHYLEKSLKKPRSCVKFAHSSTTSAMLTV
jgi:hypothetical protein